MYAEAGYRSKTGKFITNFEDVSFISTNDVVSSTLLNAYDERLPMFTMNLRGCCPNFAEDMAGKYNTFLTLDPLILKTPAMI